MNFILRVKSAGKKPWKSQYLYCLQVILRLKLHKLWQTCCHGGWRSHASCKERFIEARLQFGTVGWPLLLTKNARLLMQRCKLWKIQIRKLQDNWKEWPQEKYSRLVHLQNYCFSCFRCANWGEDMNFILRVKSAGKKPWKSQYLYYLLAASYSQIEIAQTLTNLLPWRMTLACIVQGTFHWSQATIWHCWMAIAAHKERTAVNAAL